ncbi:hypothetical protein [Mycobacterium avium]|nr:hypothetical protein [Mycobacterium avium]
MRMSGEAVGFPLPALFIDEAQFPSAADYGFRLPSENPSRQLAPLQRVAVDVSDRYAIGLYEVNVGSSGPAIGTELVKLTGSVFTEPHPDPWWIDVHDRAQLLLVGVGPVREYLLPGSVSIDLLPHLHIGVCRLLVRAYSSGLGTRPPE